MTKLERLLDERPCFKTIAAAVKFAEGYIGRRVVIEQDGVFSVMSPQSARRYSLKVVAEV